MPSPVTRVLDTRRAHAECSLDEVANALRGTDYRDDAIKAVRAFRIARNEINAILDRMVDDGYGN